MVLPLKTELPFVAVRFASPGCDKMGSEAGLAIRLGIGAFGY